MGQDVRCTKADRGLAQQTLLPPGSFWGLPSVRWKSGSERIWVWSSGAGGRCLPHPSASFLGAGKAGELLEIQDLSDLDQWPHNLLASFFKVFS